MFKITEEGTYVPLSPKYYYKYQIGNDGKYDPAAPHHDKWNEYHLSLVMSQADYNSYGKVMRSDELSSIHYGDTTAFDSSMVLRAQAKLAEHVKGSSLQLGKSLGEGRQTVNMIVSNLKGIASFAHYIKHGDLSKAVESLAVAYEAPKIRKTTRLTFKNSTYRDILNKDTALWRNKKDVSNRFLELQFGWKPLLADAQDAMQTFALWNDGPREYEIKSRKRNAPKLINSSTNPALYTGFAQYTDEIYYTYRMTEVMSWQRALGLTNILGIAWEVTPFSFIGDWFLPFGEYLDTLNVLPYLEGSFLETRIRRISHMSGSTIGVDIFNYNGSSHRGIRVNMDRRVLPRLTSINIPFPSFKPMSKALTSLHISEAVALFHQRMGRTFEASPKPYR